MKVYALPRGRGKTTELIKLAEQEFLYIVCATLTDAQYVQRMAQDMGADIPCPISWEEFATHRYHGRGIKGFAIDNLDLCIQAMTHVPIRAVSVTIPEPDAAGTTPPGTAAPG